MPYNPNILDTSAPQMRQLDIATPVNMYNSIKSARAQQRLQDLTLSQAEKKAKRQEQYQNIMSNSLNEKGQINSEQAISNLNQAGLFEESQAIQNRMQTAFENKQKLKSEMDLKKGKMAEAVLSASNPVDAFMAMREDAVKNKIELSPGLINYMPLDEEIADGGLDPKVRAELDYLSKKAVSPTGPMSIEDKIDLMNRRYNLKKDLVKTTGEIKAEMPLTKAQILDAAVKSQKMTLDKQKQVQDVLENSPEFKGLVAKAIQDAKGEISAKDKKLAGQTKLSNNIKKMAGYWNLLDKRGAAISTDKGWFDNLGNRIAASDFGQFAAGSVGGKTQSIREKIKTLKPAIILSIKDANPSIGAKGMDTPKELEFYLSAVGNEKRDIQSNMAALVILEESMGLKSSVKVTPKIKEEMQKLKSSEEVKAAQLEDLQTHFEQGNTEDPNSLTDDELKEFK